MSPKAVQGSQFDHGIGDEAADHHRDGDHGGRQQRGIEPPPHGHPQQHLQSDERPSSTIAHTPSHAWSTEALCRVLA